MDIIIAIVSLRTIMPDFNFFIDIVFNSQSPKSGNCKQFLGNPKWHSTTCPTQPLFFFPSLNKVTPHSAAILTKSFPIISCNFLVASSLS